MPADNSTVAFMRLKPAVDLVDGLPRSEIDERYIDSPYYIAPDGQVGQDAFAVIRDTPLAK